LIDIDLWTFEIPGAHAIQWYGEEGEVEFASVRGRIVRPAESIADTGLIAALIAAHADQLARNNAAFEAAKAETAAFVEEQKRLGEERLKADMLSPTYRELDADGNFVTYTAEEWVALKEAEEAANSGATV
jgi:sialic acid synthase SpsE